MIGSLVSGIWKTLQKKKISDSERLSIAELGIALHRGKFLPILTGIYTSSATNLITGISLDMNDRIPIRIALTVYASICFLVAGIYAFRIDVIAEKITQEKGKAEPEFFEASFLEECAPFFSITVFTVVSFVLLLFWY